MKEFSELVKSVVSGHAPERIVSEAVSGPDRKDDFTSDEVKVREFTRIAAQCANAYPYIGPDWINAIADQLRSSDPAGMSELMDMARRHRNEYAGSAKIDSGGSFQLWDAILNGLLAVQAHQLPPPPAPMTSKPELA